MLKTITAIFICGLLAIVGCAAPSASAAAPTPASAPAESAPEPAPAAEAAPATQREQEAAVSPTAGDEAALYRGVIEEFAVADDGCTVLLLRRPDGSDFAPSLKAKLTADTQSGDAQFGNGSFVEITHTGSENADGTVTALSLMLLEPVEAVNYNGTLTEIVREGDSGQLLTEPLNGGMPFTFNFGPETVFFAPLDELKPGDILNIYHSTMTTRSIPPQSPAFEVRLYTVPEAGKADPPAYTPAS